MTSEGYCYFEIRNLEILCMFVGDADLNAAGG